jgi:tetratricopeptide (TPR) repeat protein
MRDPMPDPGSDKLTQLFKLLEREPNDTFLLYGIGMEYKKLGFPDRAVEYFDRTIAADAGYCYAYYQRGQVCAQIGRLDEAKRSYQQGIAAAERVGDAHAREELQAALEMVE